MTDRAPSGSELARQFHAEVVGAAAGPAVARLPAWAGSIEQWVTSHGLLASPARRPALRAAYRAWAGLG